MVGFVLCGCARKLRDLLCGKVYLFVKGSAARAISGLQLTSANYSAALEVLRERFAQKQIIINSHMESLIKLKPVNAISDVRGIRAVLDRVEIQVRGLQSLGIDSAQYGALLIPIFMEKLLDEKLIVSRKHKVDWELNSVLEAVKSEVEARERSGIQLVNDRKTVSEEATLSHGKRQRNCERPIKWRGQI